VALARAMVKHPKVFLMDEPLSNLDAKLRIQMRVELIELQKQLKTTFVYVTHDQVEAMSMADEIVLMHRGAILQTGRPEEIYGDPGNAYIAQFIGSPAMNILALPDGSRLGFRPEKVVLSKTPTGDKYFRAGKIVTREMLGSETIYKLALERDSIMVKSTRDDFAVGENVIANVAEKQIYFFGADGNRVREARSCERLLNLAEARFSGGKSLLAGKRLKRVKGMEYHDAKDPD